MLKGITKPLCFYDLIGIAQEGVVSIGRMSESMIRLDCSDVPFLLSRKHARVSFEEGGQVVMRDLNSTNGTYVARNGEQLRKLDADEVWVMQDGDIIGFGGPKTIVARSDVPDVTVPNPFLFKFQPFKDDDDLGIATIKPPRYVRTGECKRLQLSPSEAPMPGTESTGIEEPTPCEAEENFTGKEVAEVLFNNLMCSICHGWLAASHTMTCGHMFCGSCLSSWLERQRSCPECRKPFSGMPVRCRNIDNTINELLKRNLASPSSKYERQIKLFTWRVMQNDVTKNWEEFLLRRQKTGKETTRR
mmetsp:Transcript_32844/g.59511  ORF Transcript_32844/g.59511 Transcript_32844/m.59511 type:complete len:303 (-) Transcript_32844:669-1577(-)